MWLIKKNKKWSFQVSLAGFISHFGTRLGRQIGVMNLFIGNCENCYFVWLLMNDVWLFNGLDLILLFLLFLETNFAVIATTTQSGDVSTEFFIATIHSFLQWFVELRI